MNDILNTEPFKAFAENICFKTLTDCLNELTPVQLGCTLTDIMALHAQENIRYELLEFLQLQCGGSGYKNLIVQYFAKYDPRFNEREASLYGYLKNLEELSFIGVDRSSKYEYLFITQKGARTIKALSPLYRGLMKCSGLTATRLTQQIKERSILRLHFPLTLTEHNHPLNWQNVTLERVKGVQRTILTRDAFYCDNLSHKRALVCFLTPTNLNNPDYFKELYDAILALDWLSGFLPPLYLTFVSPLPIDCERLEALEQEAVVTVYHIDTYNQTSLQV